MVAAISDTSIPAQIGHPRCRAILGSRRPRSEGSLGADLRGRRSAFVFGNSSGGILAPDAAGQQLSIPKLALYGESRPEAVEIFLTKVMQMPPPAVAGMRKSPFWPGLEELAHTLSSDVP